jgi:hypothetical protein
MREIMSEVQRLLIEENGETYEIFVETKSTPIMPDTSPADEGERPGAMGGKPNNLVKMQQARRMIRGYAAYVLGAFKDFATAEVKEVNLKFGIKLGGKAGIPFITEGTAESNLEIEVKCTFPKAAATQNTET